MDIGKIINNIILCIRFPFLYTRNRFTGKHYSNWKLIEKQKAIFIKWRKYSETHQGLYIKKFGPECTFMNGECIKSTYIMKLASLKDKFLYKFYKWCESFLRIFHCIPIYTELDYMPKGWRKSFGIQMCKDIAKQLRKEHYLYKYRILDIKEKYGELRWYDNGHSINISHIIDKYTLLSSKTCINCGNPAKWISLGWINPYCDNCKIEGNKYQPLYNKCNNEENCMCNK